MFAPGARRGAGAGERPGAAAREQQGLRPPAAVPPQPGDIALGPAAGVAARRRGRSRQSSFCDAGFR